MECHTSVNCGLGLGVYGMLHVCRLWLGFMECHMSVHGGQGLWVYGMPHICSLWFGFRGLWNATRL